MDRNQLIGLLLIFALLLTYFTVFAPQVPTAPPQHQEVAEQLGAAPDTATPDRAETEPDSVTRQQRQARMGAFAQAAEGEARTVVLENQDIKVTFSNRGGMVRAVELKDYRTYRQEPLVLFDETTNNFALRVNTGQGTLDLAQLFYDTDAPATLTVAAGDTQRVTFRLTLGDGQAVEHTYTLADQGFELGYNLRLRGLQRTLRGEQVELLWEERLRHLEKDITQSRNLTSINWYETADGFEELSPTSEDTETAEVSAAIGWIAFKQKFFTAGLVAEQQPFAAANLRSTVNLADTQTVKEFQAIVALPLADLQGATGGQYKFYFGPNQYNLLSNVTEGFSRNVYLGWALFGWVNTLVIIPVFQFLEKFIGNYGLIIILLVVIIKLLLFPLSYRSYISMAKMRVLKPELDTIREQNTDDMQKQQQEQMKLYQQVGVNPLSGCVPLVLQMPILLAMFYFFPNSVELRQQGFLWADDLSTYDSIFDLPFTIPGYGAHVSLFTLLMTLSQLAYTYYNNQLTTTVQGPMKAITYLMPVIFLFVLNSYPAGLSFYYFVSNIVTVSQQLIIRRFVDEDKIRARLDQNREKNKTKKKSKFQTRIEEAMKAAQQEQRNSPNGTPPRGKKTR